MFKCNLRFSTKQLKQGGLKMKKLFTLIVSALYCFVLLADDPAGSWVISNEGRIEAKKISFRDTKTTLLLENGKKLTISNDQIKSYSLKGKEYKKLQLYLDGKVTDKSVFMELVKEENDMTLYKYSTASYSPNLKIVSFLLFKGDKLVFQYDEKSHRCALNANP
jgi:hypothetical protein